MRRWRGRERSRVRAGTRPRDRAPKEEVAMKRWLERIEEALAAAAFAEEGEAETARRLARHREA